jgi:Tfp pilus assembly protein PilX
MTKYLNKRINKQAKQAGVVLFFALIALVAMSLAAVALIRSVDSNSIIAGNLSFKQSTMFLSDRGVETAMTNWLSNTANNFTVDNAAVGYFATITDVNGNTVLDDNADAKELVNDNGINVVAKLGDPLGDTTSYVIQRMCTNTGLPDASHCLLGSSDPGKCNQVNDPLCKAIVVSSSVVYRVTARVQGPKNTVSYIQTFVY